MEVQVAGNNGRKRRACQMMETCRFPLDDLNQDLLERVLAWLPTAAFSRLKSVCKRWKSAADSAAFRRACSQVPRRDPWFLMVDARSDMDFRRSAVFDSSENGWKTIDLAPLLRQGCENRKPDAGDFIPVAASGGLICFRAADGDFLVANPVDAAAASRRIGYPFPESPVRAIAMVTQSEGFELVTVSGELPNLKFRRYNSERDEWAPETALTQKSSAAGEASDECTQTQYFLTKSGNVVSADIQRSAAKQYSSVLTVKDGDEILSFISSSGTIISCNLNHKSFSEHPRLLPVFSEYSIDLVESGGEMYVVLLSEFLESSSLRVWRWDDGVGFWRQVAAMPPWMSHKLHGKKADINCGGAAAGEMLVCLNSGEVCSYVMCNLETNDWTELEEFSCDGKIRDFVCGVPFEPRIEASVWGNNDNSKN
ncbi:F-box only protein 13 [Andrographis paniculata]|uniref:F-box only protein 13 n=1 Tax=Andrographis paniculata TaxID=175694 RepID=UPI0021E7A0B2|nr:F-box only protein 13 [Andrographis paniculata]